MKRKSLFKKGMALFTATVMTAGLVACGGSAKETSDDVASDGAEAKTEQTSETEEKAEVTEVEKIVVPYMLTMNAAEETSLVQDAVNEITKEKIGVEVEFLNIDFASWESQLNLLLTDGDVDLFNCCFMSPVSTYADSGALAPLDDLVAQYGSGLKDTLGDYIEVGRFDGELYGIPKVDAYSNRPIVIMDAEICDELSIDPKSINNFDDLTEVAKKVKEAHPDLAIFPTGTTGDFMGPIGFDTLGTGGNGVFGGLILDNNDLKVVNVYETEQFDEMLKYTHEWMDLGLFVDDPLNSQDGAVAYLSNKQAFCFVGSGFDPEVSARVQENNCGMRLYGAQLDDTNYATTDSTSGMLWCIPSVSEHQEAAMKFLNELYVNADLANLVCSGIEGKHYVKNDDGTIDFAEGLDAFTTGWPSGMGTFWPNITITYPWVPNSADYYDSWTASNDTAKKSPAMGFTFNTSPVSDEIAACTNVITQYYNSVVLGIGNRDELLSQFRQELHDAGIDAIIAEKQKQLDEWNGNK